METVNRKIDVAIEPSVGEIAKLIWSMDSDEQAFLLHQLAYHFGKNQANGYMQMLYIAEDIVKRNEIKEVGKFIDDLNEYLGTKALREEADKGVTDADSD